MKASIIQIGNSRGIRIPKPIFEQCGFEDEVDLVIQNHELVIRPAHQPREGWATAFKSMANHGDDKLLDTSATTTDWDENEWEWK
jgi:antitoxin MazE